MTLFTDYTPITNKFTNSVVMRTKWSIKRIGFSDFIAIYMSYLGVLLHYFWHGHRVFMIELKSYEILYGLEKVLDIFLLARKIFGMTRQWRRAQLIRKELRRHEGLGFVSYMSSFIGKLSVSNYYELFLRLVAWLWKGPRQPSLPPPPGTF